MITSTSPSQNGHNNMEVSDNPGCFWLFGLFFIVMGLLGLGIVMIDAETFSGFPLWQRIAVVGATAGLVWVGLYLVYSSPRTNVTVKPIVGTLTIRRKGLLYQSQRSYPVGDIEEVYVAEERDGEGDSVYLVRMRLRQQDEVDLFKLWSPNHEQQLERAELVRSFLLSVR